MRNRICVGCALFLTLFLPLCAAAQQTAKPLGTTGAPYGYYEYLPDGYDSGAGEWPVLFFFHGQGQIGNGTTQLSNVLAYGVPQNIANGTDYPFIVISPQTSGEWDAVAVDALVEFVKSQYRVDPDRIYLTGISLGGGGVWNYAKSHPEKLAAILPICGSPTVPNGAKLTQLPVWAFHSLGDSVVLSQNSIDWADDIAEALSATPPAGVMTSYPGSTLDRTASFDPDTEDWTWNSGVPAVTDGQLHLTIYQGSSHEIWPGTYANQDVWDWLLAQERPDACPTGTPGIQLIEIAGAGAAGSYFSLQNAFDAQPRASSACEPLGGSGGNDVPQPFSSLVGYIDFGPDWQNVRITATWTRYRAWSTGDQTPYAELWWDDDTDDDNDSGFTETSLNFNTAQDLDTGLSEPWLRDVDLGNAPVTPKARYLLARTPSGMTGRAKEYAILGYIESPGQLITPAGAGTASGSSWFPMDDAFDGGTTLGTGGEPEGGTANDQAPYLANRTGYIDFGPDWQDVRITSTWTLYRTWSVGDQTPYSEVWWDDDTDTTNDSGLDETDVNFNTAQDLDTGMTEPWLRDRDLSANPVTPKARYLLFQSPSDMTDRAQEYAIIGFIAD